MADYEELVKSLWNCADNSCEKCAYLNQDEQSCFVKFCGILQEAADAIEELQRLVEANKTSRWISVEERLPEVDKRVLVWRRSEKFGYSYVTTAELLTYGAWTLEGITHWMPLPSPPDHFREAPKLVEPQKEET